MDLGVELRGADLLRESTGRRPAQFGPVQSRPGLVVTAVAQMATCLPSPPKMARSE